MRKILILVITITLLTSCLFKKNKKNENNEKNTDWNIFRGNNSLNGVSDEELPDSLKIIWEYDEDLSEASSPVATEEYLFLASGIGIVSCFDVKTGEQYWFQEFDEGFYSSPIVVGDLVYLIDKKGTTYIFKADNKYEVISESALGENAVATPAFMPGRIYIRGEKHLYCIGNKDG